MLVFWKESLVYLAIPKTGTTSVHATAGPFADVVFRDPPGLKHSHAYRFDRFVAPVFGRVEPRTWEKVAVIREPVDWLGSWFRYRQRPALNEHPNSTRDLTFAEFVAEYLDAPRTPRVNVGTQGWFVCDGDQVIVDHLFRYEAMDRFGAFLGERLGRRFDFPRRNASPKGDLSLPRDLRRKLQDTHARDFAIYEDALS